MTVTGSAAQATSQVPTPHAPAVGGPTDDAQRLYLAVVRLVRAMRPLASPLSPAVASALATLCAAPDGMRVGELAEVERVGAPTMTRVVAALERDGLVQRRSDPADGRAWVVTVSPAGRDAAEAGRGARITELARRLEAVRHDPGQLELAARLLERLAEDEPLQRTQ